MDVFVNLDVISDIWCIRVSNKLRQMDYMYGALYQYHGCLGLERHFLSASAFVQFTAFRSAKAADSEAGDLSPWQQ